MSSPSASEWLQRAHALVKAGNSTGARKVLDEALLAHPEEAVLANAAGDLAIKAGDLEHAEAHFNKARGLAPSNLDFAINHAIALQRLKRPEEALDVLHTIENAAKNLPKYCSVRAGCHRDAHDLANAGLWYDAAIAANPAYALALHGRARVALERGEADAVQRYQATLAANQMDAEAWLGLAEAQDAAGEAAQARNLAEQLVAQGPHWIAALRFLAQLRLAAGEKNFTDHFEEAARKRPDDPAIVHAHVGVLDSHDRFDEALHVVTSARSRFRDNPSVALLEAAQASAAGEDDLAQQIFDSLDLETTARWSQEARHCLRTGRYDRSAELLDRVIETEPDNISAWAMRDLLWRHQGDERAEWLHGQDGLVQLVPLPDAESVLEKAVPLLHELHDSSAFPLGQSLRGGTQTRGNLFERGEAPLARLHDSLAGALEIYRSNLPERDDRHPLLKHRDDLWRISGSWSVRLSAGGDFHTAHLHPQGIISSASYLILPEDLGIGEDEKAGWIELGRPAPDLRIDLPPLYSIQPKRGHLALFPSTLYHGTRPFGHGQRMTVAIDITLANLSGHGERG